MLRFRLKQPSERDKEWLCCFCLHVRTGTIILGIWHLLLYLVTLGLLLAIFRDPRLLAELEDETDGVLDWSDPVALPTPLSNQAQYHTIPGASTQLRDHSLVYHDLDMGALVTVCMLAITLMMVYGAARGKPAHLLPFFCLQLFDFAMTTLTMTGYLCYLRSVHRLVADARRVPFRSALLALPAPALSVLVLLVFITIMMVKAYCISMVWRCYKYLTMRMHAVRTLTPYVISAASGGADLTGAGGSPVRPDYSTLLPDYEEAVKLAPPPSYNVATQLPPYQQVALPATTPVTSPATDPTSTTADTQALTAGQPQAVPSAAGLATTAVVLPRESGAQLSQV